MKQRPILFSTGMVQAILEGRKTQTRRVVKPQPYIDKSDNFCWDGKNFGQSIEGFPRIQAIASPVPSSVTKRVFCPYGAVGDVLWVRESWAETTNIERIHPWPNRPHTQTGDDSAIIYRADGHWQWLDDDGCMTDKTHWKPSIHMPRAACRLFLKITSVRVERLHDISEEDAKAEGVERSRSGDGRIVYKHYLKPKYGPSPVHSFQTLWEKINGAESWESNPWVWVVEFERIEKPKATL